MFGTPDVGEIGLKQVSPASVSTIEGSVCRRTVNWDCEYVSPVPLRLFVPLWATFWFWSFAFLAFFLAGSCKAAIKTKWRVWAKHPMCATCSLLQSRFVALIILLPLSRTIMLHLFNGSEYWVRIFLIITEMALPVCLPLKGMTSSTLSKSTKSLLT